jgi:hypothetical protein
MDPILRQINRARRRLLVQRFVNTTAIWMFALLMIAAVAMLVPKMGALQVNQSQWISAWLIGAICVSVLGGALSTWLSGAGSLDAAIEVDRRFGLKERLSSSMALSTADTETPGGQALMEDAARKAERIDVSDQFGIQTSWLSFLFLIPAVLVFVLAVFVPDATREETTAAASEMSSKKQVQNSTDQLKKKLAERRKMAEEEGLEAAKDLFTQLEKGVADLQKMKDLNEKKAMVKLNNLAEQLQKRRQSMGDSRKLKEQLNQLKKLKTGPADRMSQALKKGNFPAARKALQQLQNKLAAGKLSEKDQKRLAEQLRQMSEKLNQLVQSQREAKETLQREIQRQRESGNLAKAAELQKKLDKLAAQDSQMQKLSKMADKLAQTSKNLSEKQLAEAARAMSQLAESMSEMQVSLEELELMDEVMEQLADAKNAMTCKQCQGEGCSMCQGGMSGMMAMGRGQRMTGMGMGEGRGVGDRPEAKTNKNFYDSKVRANAGRGRAVITGLAKGPNVAGEALEEIKSTLQSADYDSDDPLSGNRLPKNVRDHVRDYFERRGGADDSR